jgi:hypothetical protein
MCMQGIAAAVHPQHACGIQSCSFQGTVTVHSGLNLKGGGMHAREIAIQALAEAELLCWYYSAAREESECKV